MKCFLRLLAVALLVAMAAPGMADAEERPIQLALFNPIQIFSEGDAIHGIRINLIYGKNTAVRGIDYGLINHTTTGESMGWQLGFVGLVDEDFVGFQDNVVNIVGGDFEGLQFGVVVIVSIMLLAFYNDIVSF